MINNIKIQFPNIYILIMAISISIWFNGINYILNTLMKSSIKNGVILLGISLFIFYMDDKMLSELYNHDNDTSHKGDMMVISAANSI